MKSTPFYIGLCFLLLPILLTAQSSRNSSLVSSAAAFSLGKNEIELNTFSAFSYNQRAFNFSNPPYRYYEQRFHSLNSGLQLTYGITQSQLLNVGLDLNQITSFEAAGEGNSVGFGQMGPRLRWRPFGELGERFDLAFQNSVLFTVGDNEGLFTKDALFKNQLIASQFYRFSELKMDVIVQGLMEVNIMPRVRDVDQKRPLAVPVSLLVGVMPNEIWVLFASLGHTSEWGTIPWAESETYYHRRSATTISLGVQHIFARRHALFVSHAFLLDQQYGGGSHTVSFGLRLLFIEQYDD